MEKKQAYDRSIERYSERIKAQATTALNDDIGEGDITTLAVVNNPKKTEKAMIMAKAHGVLCGLKEAKVILEEGGLEFEYKKMEGEVIQKGDIIASVRGEIGEILKRERTALNYLQVLSGIATATHKLAQRFPKKVSSLRKTHPGLCYSEKRAVQVGGGFTHRLGLYDGFLIKDNHLAAIVHEMSGEKQFTEKNKIEAIRQALKRAKQYRDNNRLENCFIEIEVESLAQAVAAASNYKENGVPDMILLDNMKPQDVAKCVEAIRREAGRKVIIESSGGVTVENIDDYIKAGVDIVSTSKITVNAEPLDMSMKIIGFK